MPTEQERAERRLFQKRTVWVALVVIGIATTFWLILELGNILFMVFVALFLAVALEPPVHYLAKRGWRRGSATGVVFLVGFLLVGAFVWALAPLFIRQINQILDSIPGWIDNTITWLDQTFSFDLSELSTEDIGAEIGSGVQDVAGALFGGVIGLATGIGGFLIFATTVALFAFYMIAELPQLQRTVLQWMPEQDQRRALHIWDIAVEKMGGYIYSRLVLAIVSATLSTIFLGLLDIPFALSLGIWVGVLSQFVPVVGTYLAAILPSIVALSSNGTSTMIWVIIFFVAYQQIENYVFSPRITKRTMEIHPAVSVAAIFIGGQLMGGIGVILALPMTGIIQAIISETGKRHDVVTHDDAEPSQA